MEKILYVNTIVRDLGFLHPENKLSKGAIYRFETHRDLWHLY